MSRYGLSPLHLACTWGLELVVQCLMEYNANVNSFTPALPYIKYTTEPYISGIICKYEW